jgi:AraC-like DNA-binding protein
MKIPIEKPYKAVNYEWLTSPQEGWDTTSTDFGQPGWIDYPLPPEMGKGGYESLDLTMGMTFVHSILTFTPAMLGQNLPVMDVEVEFNEPSFQAMALRGLHGNIKEQFPAAHLTASSGVDIFRYTSKYHSVFTVDATYSGETCHVSLGRSVFDILLGADVAETLLKAMTIIQSPSISVQPIPLHVSNLLFSALNPTLTGAARNLFCQAQVLDYLSRLVTHFCNDNRPETQPTYSKKRVQMLHEYLLSCDGKLPTLDELSIQFGRSAKLLNIEFARELGMPIHTFMAEHRLSQAHTALQESNIPIKNLAANLGYSHVSNFTIAFKRKFGYPPGSLRKRF